MANFPHIIEAALLLLVTFLIGCIIGWFLRAKIFKRPTAKSEVSVSSSRISKVEKTVSEPAPISKPAPKPATLVKPVLTKTTPKPKPEKPEIAAVLPEKSTKSTSQKPAGLDAPRNGNKDDLKKIKGVGPKLEGTLNGLGIYHFDQIAKWTPKEIVWVDDFLSFKGRIDRDDWIAQAKNLT